jgi:hypothetical protein
MIQPFAPPCSDHGAQYDSSPYESFSGEPALMQSFFRLDLGPASIKLGPSSSSLMNPLLFVDKAPNRAHSLVLD